MQLELAAYGWSSPEWDSLYPEDLPIDWRLDYYGNTFRAIVVPAETWQGVSIDEARGWLDEALPGFRFYWEIGDADGATRLLELLPQIKQGQGELSGWLFRSGLKLEHGLFDELASVLPGAAYGEAPLPSVRAEQLAAEGITLCWQDGTQLNCRGNGLRVMQLLSYPDLRDLRRIVDKQVEEDTEKLLIVLKPGAISGDQIHDLLTFITLLNG